MNIHKNARLTPLRREEMARDVVEGRLSKAHAARTYGVTAKVVGAGWSVSEPRDTPAWPTVPRGRRRAQGEPRPRWRTRSQRCAGSA